MSDDLNLPSTAPSCIPPLIWKCEGQLDGSTLCSCSPAPPRAVQMCQVSIIYNPDIPNAPFMLPMSPGCDAAGVELAVAVMLAKLLGGS